MIGAADKAYQGKYVWEEGSWKSSWVCNMAGFLSFVSSEVSAFMICLITLDRFLVMRFPFNTLHFKGRSAVLISLLAWVLGLLVSALSFLTDWDFYGQTGICIPLPISRRQSTGMDYSFGVLIVFNFVLFVLIVVGQAVVYASVHSSSKDLTKSSPAHNAGVARRLFIVVLSDFLCWFPICMLGLATSSGLPVPGEASVVVAIFVLPLNSAINPFLYTINIIIEKRWMQQEAKLLAALRKEARDRNRAPALDTTAHL
jgi:hypothetical protein